MCCVAIEVALVALQCILDGWMKGGREGKRGQFGRDYYFPLLLLLLLLCPEVVGCMLCSVTRFCRECRSDETHCEETRGGQEGVRGRGGAFLFKQLQWVEKTF